MCGLLLITRNIALSNEHDRAPKSAQSPYHYNLLLRCTYYMEQRGAERAFAILTKCVSYNVMSTIQDF